MRIAGKLWRGLKIVESPGKRKPTELDALYNQNEAKAKIAEWKQMILSKRSQQVLAKVESSKEVQVKGGKDEVATIDFNSSVRPKPKEGFALTKADYSRLQSKAAGKGKANVVTYKGSQVSFISTSFEGLALAKLWGLLQASRADIVIVQARPDLLPNFSIKDVGPDKYASQLYKRPWEIMPSPEYRDQVMKDLELLGQPVQLSKDVSDEYKIELREAIRARRNNTIVSDCLDQTTIAAVATYCESKGIDALIGEIPDIIHRLHLANTLTRYHLSNLLDFSSKELVYNKNLLPATPWNAAHYLFPEYMTRPSDIYMAQIVDWVVERGYKRPLVLLGGTQSLSVPEYLFQRINPHGLEEILTPPPWKVGITDDYFVEDIVEKMSILDVMQYGPKLFAEFEKLNFKSTYSIMNKYMHEETVQQQYGELRYIHYRLLKKYYEQMAERMEFAEKELQRLYLSRT